MRTQRGRRMALALVTSVAWLAAASPAVQGAAQPPPTAPTVALVEIDLESPAAERALASLGLDVIALRPGHSARILSWPGDEAALRRAGLAARILDADWGRTLARDAAPPTAAPHVAGSVPPFGSGSLAGFYNLAEVEQYLADVAAADVAGIVSGPVQIGTSRQGRPILALRVGAESQPDHSRPRVLFTALTHAREPGGMQVVLYFIDKLLAGYGSDPDLTYLVDHREIWFVPCVNPDGYVINENIWLMGGGFGLWRKNARDNNSDGMLQDGEGVDLNRNFGFQWGFDEQGSSSSSGSQTYRGPAAFSEPETQALRDFCVVHGFTTANNYHTFFEGTLYPWAYSGVPSPDDAFYVRLADAMLRDPHYAYGIAEELLYPVNGDSNDWMYGEQITKPKVYALTTEVGNQDDGFWPPAARILPLAHSQLRSNIVLAYGAGTWVHCDAATLVSSDGWLHPSGSAEIALTLRNDGVVATDGAVTVTATTTTPGITITDAVSTFVAMAAGATASPAGADRLAVSAGPGVAAGTVVPLHLQIRDAGAFVFHDTTTITVGQPAVVFDDPATNLANWTAAPAGTWGTQNIGGDLWFSDSPAGNYPGGTNRRLTLNAPLDLTGGVAAFMTFETRWWIEGGYDFARVEASTDGVTWTALAGRNTRPGHGTTGAYTGGTQTLGAPGYDMTQRFAITEVVDLSAYVGRNDVRLRLRLTSDNGAQYDGWHVDDVRVLVYPPEEATDAGPEARPEATITLAAASRNPFRDRTTLRATFARPTPFRAAVYAVDGRRVRVLATGMAAAGTRDLVWDGSSDDGRPVAAGTYLVRVESAAGHAVRQVVRLR
jgi:hypothetical protein